MSPRCSGCVHAAFDQGGCVYCTEFNEQILNERVAEDCGAFEPEGDAAAPRGPQLSVVHACGNGSEVAETVDQVADMPVRGFDTEANHLLSMRVEMPVYGKAEHLEQVAARVTAVLELNFGSKVKVGRG